MADRRFGNITLVEGKNNGRYPFCHTLLIEDSVRVLVDPACGQKKMAAMRERAEVDLIINTHYHEDHVAYNHLFPEAEIWAHRADRIGLSSIEGYFRVGIEMPPGMREQWSRILADRFHYLGWTPSRFIEDGEELLIGETRIRVVHAPGHTPGQVCLHFPDHELLYLADLDMSRFGPWYGDKTSDIDALVQSVKKVKEIDARWYVPSHEGPVFEDIVELADAYVRVVEEREERVLENLAEPASLEELAARWIIYKKPRTPEEFFMPSERAMLGKHLERLAGRGMVVLEGEKFVLT